MKLMAYALLLLLSLGYAASAASDEEPSPYAVEPLLAEIRVRQAQLDRRERDLEERERTQDELEALIEDQLQEIKQQHETIESRIAAWEKKGNPRIKRLAKIYEAMQPANAAELLERLDANLATQIIAKMKHKKSAAVIERVSKKRALTVSRQVAHPLSFDPATETEGGT